MPARQRDRSRTIDLDPEPRRDGGAHLPASGALTERDGWSENYRLMHDETASPSRAAKERRGLGAAGGIVVALGLAAAKFQWLIAIAVNFKWLLLGPKLLSLGSMFLSVWLYAQLFGGWKIGIVFVLMILVHELGHYFTWRNYGVKASLPMFIPGFGAFVSAPTTGTPAQNTAAAMAGPLFGVAAAAVCWGYGVVTGEPALAPTIASGSAAPTSASSSTSST